MPVFVVIWCYTENHLNKITIMAKHEGTTNVKVFKDHGPAGFAAFVAFVGAFVYFARDAQDLWRILTHL